MTAPAPLRVGVLGAPVARPLDFADAFLGGEIDPLRMESEERGRVRVVVVEADHGARRLHLVVAITPRAGAAEAFEDVLAEVDVAIVVASAGGWSEQETTVAAIARARDARPDVPVVHVVNDFVPPRLEQDPRDDAELARRLGTQAWLRGRICWWRHERSGTATAREAVERAAAAADARR